MRNNGSPASKGRHVLKPLPILILLLFYPAKLENPSVVWKMIFRGDFENDFYANTKAEGRCPLMKKIVQNFLFNAKPLSKNTIKAQ